MERQEWKDICSIHQSLLQGDHALETNLFKVPTGKSGKALVRELACMFQAYADGSALEGIALQAVMVMPALLLQIPHPKSKAKEHSQHLEHHLQLWLEGNIDSLMDEGRTIQLQFTRNHPSQK